MGPARTETESHGGNQAYDHFDGPLAATVGWLETKINNSLRKSWQLSLAKEPEMVVTYTKQRPAQEAGFWKGKRAMQGN